MVSRSFSSLITGYVAGIYFPIMSSQPLLQSAPGKRIALPTRVEPKVFFANERTFLSWLNFSVILGALAVGMLNFGDRTSFISALVFMAVAVCGMVYALYTYHWRAKSIRKRGQAGFDDKIGPTVLAAALIMGIVVNFLLRVISMRREDNLQRGVVGLSQR